MCGFLNVSVQNFSLVMIACLEGDFLQSANDRKLESNIRSQTGLHA